MGAKDFTHPELKIVAMWDLGIVLFVLRLLVLDVAAQNDTLTLDEVQAQMSSFLNGVENGALSARGTDSLPSGCSLAVRTLVVPMGLRLMLSSVHS